MALTNEYIKEQLTAKFEGEGLQWDDSGDIFTLTIPKSLNLKVLQFLFDEPSLGFRFLTDLCAVHYPDNKGAELAVVYHLHNFKENVRLRLKLYTDITQPDVYTATNIFPGANWMERETFDFFGVNFVGHPQLKRILNVEDMDYFPLRKEYPLEDQTRTDKDDAMFGRGNNY